MARERDVVLCSGATPREDSSFQGGDLARAWPGDRVDDELADAIRGAFYLGPLRTPGTGRRVRHRSTRRGRRAGPLARCQRPIHGDQLYRPAGGGTLSPWPRRSSPRPTATTRTAGSALSPTPRPSRGSSMPRSTRSARRRGTTWRWLLPPARVNRHRRDAGSKRRHARRVAASGRDGPSGQPGGPAGGMGPSAQPTSGSAPSSGRLGRRGPVERRYFIQRVKMTPKVYFPPDR